MSIEPYFLEDEESILLPCDTRFHVEAYICDVGSSVEATKDGVYSFSFHPKYAEDYLRVIQIAEKAEDKILASTPMYSNKVPSFSFENKDGSFFTSQLHAPKININLNPWDACLISGNECSLSLRFHDLKLGKILLVCDWLDLYEDPTSVEASKETVVCSDDDW